MNTTRVTHEHHLVSLCTLLGYLAMITIGRLINSKYSSMKMNANAFFIARLE